MSEPRVVTAMREFKENLLGHEAIEMNQMAGRWLTVENRLDALITQLSEDMSSKRERGEDISESSLFKMRRYQELRRQTEEEFGKYATYANDRIRQEQERLARKSLEDHQEAIELAAYPYNVGLSFDKLPYRAVEYMVGMSGEGKPLGDLLQSRLSFDPRKDNSSADVWARLTNSLTEGTALGWNPRKTTRAMKDDLTGGLNKAMCIARSEQLRTYRTVGLNQYRESGVVSGYRRICAHDERVCAACLADEGREYNLDEILSDHPNGRCGQVPIVTGMPDIEWTAGEDWYNQQSEDIQVSILGKELQQGLKDGSFVFDQLIHRSTDPTWGDSIRPWSDKVLLGDNPPPAARIKELIRLTQMEAPEKLINYYGYRNTTRLELTEFTRAINQLDAEVLDLWKAQRQLLVVVKDGEQVVGKFHNGWVILDSGSLGGTIAQHEFVHGIISQPYIARNIYKYTPGELFDHARAAPDMDYQLREDITMMLSAHDPDPDKWVQNLMGRYSDDIRHGEPIDEETARNKVKSAQYFLDQLEAPE